MRQLWHSLNEKQLRQYVDSQALFRAYQEAQKEALRMRGSVCWRESRGVNTLVGISADGTQRALGPESAQTREQYEAFVARKQQARSRLARLKLSYEEQIKLNKVYRVGRAPKLLIQILNQFEKMGIAHDLITVGSTALYAYASACGVFIGAEDLASGDIDVLSDADQRVSFLSKTVVMNASFVGLLQKVDASFSVTPTERPIALNTKGMAVKVVQAVATHAKAHDLPITMPGDESWNSPATSDTPLNSDRHFEQLVVATTGHMAMMSAPHPLDFVRFKTKWAKGALRDPVSAARDRVQAELVQALWNEFLIQQH